MRKLLVGIALLSVAGCIIAQPYDGPRTENIAFLNVRALAGYEPSIEIYREADTCTGRYFMENGAHLGRTEVSRSFARIDAGAPVSIGIFASWTNNTICKPILKFLPQPGRYYRIVMTANEAACFVSLSSSGNPAFSDAREEGYQKMVAGTGFDENGSFCSPGEFVAPRKSHTTAT